MLDFSYIDVTTYEGKIICWTRDSKGDMDVVVTDVDEHCYLFKPDNKNLDEGYFDLYGNPLRKVYFSSPWEMRQFAITSDNVLESDVAPEYKFLLDKMIDNNEDAPFNIGYYDIEVDYDLKKGMGYPTVKNPYGEINGISLFDTKNEKYVEWALHGGVLKLNDEEYPVEVRACDDEWSLLKDFCKYIDHIDVLTAWNGDGFDLPYVMERLIKNFGEKAHSMLCRDSFDAKRREYVNEYGEDSVGWTLVGRIHFDLMQLYKKFTQGELQSYKLDNVCEKEKLGFKKTVYDGDLGDLYRENPQLFFEYSLRDSKLLLKLNEKKQIIELAMTMVRSSCALPNDILGSIRMIECDLTKFGRQNGGIILPDRDVKEKEKYDGAVVYDTVVGLHEWVFGVDLRSLYPFTMIMLGLSPETILGQLVGEYEDYIKVMTKDDTGGCVELILAETGELIEILPSELEETIRSDGWTISAAGVIFTGKLGFLSRYVSEGFKLRSTYKKQMFVCRDNDDPIGEQRFNLRQNAVKVGRLNAVYGACGNEAFKLFDIRLAKSITLSAQIVSKQQALAANNYIDYLCEGL